jgi:hypothetical protein
MIPSMFRSLLVSLLCAGAAAAQCQFSSVSAQSAGPYCNLGPTGCCAIAQQPTLLRPTLEVTTCRLNVEVSALEGCCGVTVAVRLLALGAAPANLPLPQFGSGCALWLQPDVILVQQAATFSLAIPPTLPPVTFLAQGCAVITNTLFPAPTVLTLSNALALSLQ